jgi:hypothetical protein
MITWCSEDPGKFSLLTFVTLLPLGACSRPFQGLSFVVIPHRLHLNLVICEYVAKLLSIGISSLGDEVAKTTEAVKAIMPYQYSYTALSSL